MSRADVISTIRTHLESVERNGSPVFGGGMVKQDRPVGLSPFDGQCIFYSMGEGDLPEAYRNGSLTRAFLSERWAIKVFWNPTPIPEKRETRLEEQWDVRRAITSALRGDSQLGGNVSDLKVISVTQEPENYGDNDARWDVLTIVFDTWDLTGEAIAV